MPSAHSVRTWLDAGLASEWPEDWNAIGEFATLPGQLKSAGYSTALIGKYHLGQPWRAPADYDHWVTFPHGHTVSFHGNRMIENGRELVHKGHSVDFFADLTLDYLGSRRNEPDPFFCFVPFNGAYGHWPAIRGESQTRFDEIYRDLPLHSIPREGLNRRVIERYTQRVVEAGGTPHERFAGPLLLPNETTSPTNSPLPGYENGIDFVGLSWLLARLVLALYLVATALAKFDSKSLSLFEVGTRLALALAILAKPQAIHFAAIIFAATLLLFHNWRSSQPSSV